MTTEFIKPGAIFSYARRLERANMRQKHSSLSAGSISTAASPYIVELRESCIIIQRGWREAMKARAEQ